jgi:hypothetical protein
MNAIKNKPYVKIFKEGILTNPITKEAPFVNARPHYFKTSIFTVWENFRNKFFLGKVVLKAFNK